MLVEYTVVLLNTVKSLCLSVSFLYSNCLLPWSPMFPVNLSSWGNTLRALAFLSGAVWHLFHSHHHQLPHTPLIFPSSFYIFTLCWHPRRMERRRKVSLICAFSFHFSVFQKKILEKQPMINVKDYFKLARHTIGRNKYEMICTKTTILDVSRWDAQYLRGEGERCEDRLLQKVINLPINAPCKMTSSWYSRLNNTN